MNEFTPIAWIISLFLMSLVTFAFTNTIDRNARDKQGIPQEEVIESLRQNCELKLPRDKICVTEAIIQLKIVDKDAK